MNRSEAGLRLGCRTSVVNDPVQDARIPVRVLYPTRSDGRNVRFGAYEVILAMDAPMEGKGKVPRASKSHDLCRVHSRIALEQGPLRDWRRLDIRSGIYGADRILAKRSEFREGFRLPHVVRSRRREPSTGSRKNWPPASRRR